MKPVGNESEDNARDPGCAVVAGERSGQTECSVATKGEAQKRGDTIYCQWSETQGEQRKKEERYAVVVFTEGQCLMQRIEDVGVEQMKWRGEGLMKIPPQDPRN